MTSQPDTSPVEHKTVEATPTEKKTLTPNTLSYDGQTGQLYKIWFLNLIMKIITLGIYSFWGKTRLRKYVYGSFSLDGDRFEYTGTGGELFKGFLKVLPILVIILGPIVILGETQPMVLLLYIPFFYLFPVAIYGAMRYRFSRTRWRGIRARLGGSAFKYANISAVRFVINVLTLGFAIPYSDIKKMKYMMENTYFGNVKAEFYGSAKRIYGTYIKSLFLMVGILILPMLLFALPIVLESFADSMPPSDTKTNISSLPGLISAFSYLFGTLLFIMLIPVARSMYTAALMREQMRGLKVADLRFKSTVTTMRLIKHQLGNVLWIILTLGLATPIVINRKAKFLADNTIIGGDLNTTEVLQGKDDGIKSGEGLEDAFDIDTGFI